MTSEIHEHVERPTAQDDADSPAREAARAARHRTAIKRALSHHR